MIIPDANVLIYAFRRDSEHHAEYRQWLESTISDGGVLGLSDLVLSAVVRITTHTRIFAKPSTLAEVFKFTDYLREQASSVDVRAGPRHWEVFETLCRSVDARGNLVSDAYHAALAIEVGAEWITTDRDFARFPGLKWRHPLK